MKAITITSVTVVGTDITIVGTIADESPSKPITQVTVPDYSPNYKLWARALRASTEGIFSIRNDADYNVWLKKAGWVKIAAGVVPTLTYAPRITTQPSDDSCVASSTAADFTVVADSETALTYQWKYESKATTTLTSNNTNVENDAQVVIGNKTYTFKTALTPTEGEVLIGADADASLLNLIRAINHTGTPDTDYKCAAAHTQVSAAASVTAHAFVITSRLSGTAANSYATTDTSPTLSFTSTVMAGGGTWANCTGTINGTAYTNATTAALTATPTTTAMSGTEHKCTVTNGSGSTDTDTATLTIT